MRILNLSFKVFFILLSISLFAQVQKKSWKQITESKDENWFASQEAIQVAENVLLYQRNIGGWPKNIPMHQSLSEVDKKKLIALKSDPKDCTIDNGATCQELLFLSKIYKKHPDERYEKAFLQGLDYLLTAQYINGGWPQFYPLIKGYYSHITYNDDAMVNVLELFNELINKSNNYSIKPSLETLKKINYAFTKGINCILNTQYKQNGELTAWCAQHDEFSLLPAKARAYELPSLSGKESAKITLLLMSIEKPSKEVIDAIEAAVHWFEKTKIRGIKIENITKWESGKKDKVVVSSPNSEPLWARFMELDTNTPFFCDRDGIKKETLSDIGYERRNGYNWYTNEPKEVLKKYIYWKKNNKKEANSYTKQVLKDNHFVVDQNGKGDFLTIQAAVNATPAFPYERIVILIKNGIYNEKVNIPAWNPKVTLIGESREKTIISYNDYFSKINLGRNSTFSTYSLLVDGDDFIAQNLTIQNTAGEVGQAVALHLNSNRAMFVNCSFLGNQDTVYLSGDGAKNYFKNCYIEGTTDFIFGEATVLFENCVIHSKKDSFITAASTPQNTAFGFVFKECKLTADDGVAQVYLGRPWRIYAKTVFMDCEMGNHITPEAWENWSKPEAEKTTFFAEYNGKGTGFQPQKRVRWSFQLTALQAQEYSNSAILGDLFYNNCIAFLKDVESNKYIK